MTNEAHSYTPEDDPHFKQKGVLFAVFWTFLILLTAYVQYR